MHHNHLSTMTMMLSSAFAFTTPKPLKSYRYPAPNSVITAFKGTRGDRCRRLFTTLDDAILATADILPTSSTSTSESAYEYGLTPIPEFEPVLNVEAASSFFIIVVIFTLLQIRVAAISSAAQRRSNALLELRNAESLLLSGGGQEVASISDDDKSDAQSDNYIGSSNRYASLVTAAKKEYEDALRAEMELRKIAPGIRIIAPDDPRRNEEERAAAKRFLGWGSEEFGDIDTTPITATDNKSRGVDEAKRGTNDNANALSNSAKIILVGVASMLIVLLYTLSFDPMAM